MKRRSSLRDQINSQTSNHFLPRESFLHSDFILSLNRERQAPACFVANSDATVKLTVGENSLRGRRILRSRRKFSQGEKILEFSLLFSFRRLEKRSEKRSSFFKIFSHSREKRI